MTVQTFMTSPPLSLRPDDTVGLAAQQLIENRFVNLPVADRSGRYLGLFGAVEEQLEAARSFRIGDHLNRTAPVLHPESGTLEAILALYRARNTLAVVEKKTHRLVGMISYWDALRALMSQR